MRINEIRVPVRDLIQGYHEEDSTGRVSAWDGKLDVRPEFQREFVYDDKQQGAVVNTVLNGFPLNIMYFVDRGNGEYEVLDGQQRIISLCRYATNPAVSARIPLATGEYNSMNFDNLPHEKKERFLDYQLHVYVCEGTEEEKLEWFQVINVAGAVLTKQEIRNALHYGAWLTDAKSAFSKNNCSAKRKYGKYLSGDCLRQDYLETAFAWKANAEGIEGKDAIERFMRIHRVDENANDLWNYFESVFEWVKKVFGKEVDPSMKGVHWGLLYNEHKDDCLDPEDMQRQAKKLLLNEEVLRKQGIYPYLLTDEEKYLHVRQFGKDTAMTVYHRQEGKCAICGKSFAFKDMHADHAIPWSKGGRTEIGNCQMLCTTCNLKKGSH